MAIWDKYALPNRYCNQGHEEVQWKETNAFMPGKCWFCGQRGKSADERSEDNRMRKLRQLLLTQSQERDV